MASSTPASQADEVRRRKGGAATTNGNSSTSKGTDPPSKPSPIASPGVKALNYVIATRPWTFTASVMPMLLTALLLHAQDLAAHSPKPLLNLRLVATLSSGIFVQAASNLINTYFDFTSGRDTPQESGDRALVDGTVTPKGVFRLALVLYTTSILIVATILTDSHMTLAAVFFSGMALSFFYTAGPVSLKCVAMGDIVIFLCFGPLLVYFTALLLRGEEGLSLGWTTWAYTVPFGLLTESILHANNARDMEMDQRSGIVTLALLIGYDASRVLFIIMIATSYVASLLLAWHQYWGNALVLLTLPLAVDVIRRFQPKTMELLPENVAKLHCAYGALTLLGVYLSSSF